MTYNYIWKEFYIIQDFPVKTLAVFITNVLLQRGGIRIKEFEHYLKMSLWCLSQNQIPTSPKKDVFTKRILKCIYKGELLNESCIFVMYNLSMTQADNRKEGYFSFSLITFFWHNSTLGITYYCPRGLLRGPCRPRGTTSSWRRSRGSCRRRRRRRWPWRDRRRGPPPSDCRRWSCLCICPVGVSPSSSRPFHRPEVELEVRLNNKSCPTFTMSLMTLSLCLRWPTVSSLTGAPTASPMLYW